MYTTFVRNLLVAFVLLIPLVTWANTEMLCPGADKPSPLSMSGKYSYKHTPFEWSGKTPDGWELKLDATQGAQPKIATYYFWTAFFTPASPQTGEPSKIECFYVTPEEGAAESFLTLIKKNVTSVHRNTPKDKWSPELSICGCSAGICVQTLDCPFTSSNISN